MSDCVSEPREPVSEAVLKAGGKEAPKSLYPCAGDAYLMFQVKENCPKCSTIEHCHYVTI